MTDPVKVTTTTADPQGGQTTDVTTLPGLKSGWKTSEFWITLLAYVAGSVLIARGQDNLGAILMSVATVGYPVSRGIAKAGSAPTPAAS